MQLFTFCAFCIVNGVLFEGGVLFSKTSAFLKPPEWGKERDLSWVVWWKANCNLSYMLVQWLMALLLTHFGQSIHLVRWPVWADKTSLFMIRWLGPVSVLVLEFWWFKPSSACFSSNLWKRVPSTALLMCDF